MNFKDILSQAKQGNELAIEEVLKRYRPLLLKQSISMGVFDEDLYQELCMTLVNCIRNFHI